VEPDRRDEPHLPGPSLWPIGFAAGIACLLLGLVVSNVVAGVGAVLALLFGFLWVRDVTTDYRAQDVHVEPERAPERPAAGTPAAPAHLGPDAMPSGERFPRSRFLEMSTLGIGAAIGGLVTVPPLGFMVLPAFLDQDRDEVDLGPLDNFPKDEWLVATFMEKPELGEVSRRTVFIRNNGLANDDPQKPSFTILSNRCVHLGCPVQPSGLLEEDAKKEYKTTRKVKEGERTVERDVIVDLIPTKPAGFSCPCHGGSYDTEGNRIAGPPVRALDRFEFSVRDGHLMIGRGFSVADVEKTGAEAVMAKYDLHGPGEHVEGLSQFLYPLPSPPH
jgi:Rieske Fe-S protein